MTKVIKDINSKHQNSLKKIESDIKYLERKINHESFIENLFNMDGDLLEFTESLLHEFEDETGNTVEDEEDEEYSVDDNTEDEETSTDDNTTTEEPVEDEEYTMDDVEPETTDTTEPDTAAEDPATDDSEEEYTMDDVDDTAEETSTDDNTTEDQPTDDTDTGEDGYEIPDDDEGGDTAGGEGDMGDAGEEDYSMDDMEGGDDTSGTDDMSSADTTSTMSNEPASDEASQKLRDLESVVFDTLSDAEKRLKIKELKELYTSIYKKCDVVYNSLADIRRDEETIQIIEYISNTLIDLKRYVGDYIINLFDVKTYVENLAQLQKYIMIFTAINQVFEQIRTENDK